MYLRAPSWVRLSSGQTLRLTTYAQGFELYLDGLEGAAEQHVVGGDQGAHRVVMGTDGVDFLQGLDVPNLHDMHSSVRLNCACLVLEESQQGR